jgi:hypothetical protein
MSNLYILSNDNEPHTTGNVYPQISRHKGWCYDNAVYLSELKYDVVPKDFFVLDYLILEREAILTDFLTDGRLHWGFIVSEKVKCILESCKLPPHKFFELHVEVGDKMLTNYYWFFPLGGNLYTTIDFPKSKFRISHRFLPKEIVMNEIIFKNISGINKFKTENSKLAVHGQSLCFEKEIVTDIFQIGSFSFDWIITEKLKNMFYDNNVTGHKTKEINWIEL